MPNLSYTYRGLIVPVFSPFTEEFKLNLSIIPSYAKHLSDRGIKGVLANGTSGEGMSMSVSERKQVAEAWANAVKTTKQHLMIQVGGAPMPDVIELARHAEKIKADSILCLPELYFKPTNNQQLIDYLKVIADAAPNTPLLYYHIPKFSNVELHMGEFLEAMGNQIPSFVGIKFTSNNLEEGSQAMRASGGKFLVFLGSDQIMSAGCAIGMDSFIPTSVNIFPELGLEMIEAGIKGDSLEARKKQEKYNRGVLAISKHGHWTATMKTAMAVLTSINPGPVRPPIKKMTEQEVSSMKNDLRTIGFTF